MAENVSLEDLKEVIKDLSEAQRQGEVARQRLAEQVSEAQRRLAEQMSEAQQRTEAAQRRLAEQMSEAQQRTEAAQRRTEEAQQRTEAALKETQAAVEKQSKNLDKASGNFNNKWGAFMEKLVKGNLVDLLQKRGISVDAVTRKFEICDKSSKNKLAEFDLLALNGDEMVVVEVKTTLSGEKLAEFIEKLEKYKHRLPLEKRAKIYGAVAYLEDVENSKEKAMEAGLFVIEAPRRDGDFATIANPEGFGPPSYLFYFSLQTSKGRSEGNRTC